MKNFKINILLFSILIFSNFVNAQGEGYNIPPEMETKSTSEINMIKMLNAGGLKLQNMDFFPYDLIIKHNKNIGSLTIINSPNLTTITPELEHLKDLKRIYISGTKIKDFPSGIFKINGVENLEYVMNQTEKIPSDIGHLKHLNNLKLAILPITVLPKEIGQLTNLETLEITNNIGGKIIADESFNLEGIKFLPKEIGNLLKLNKLWLYENGFENLPKEIGNLVNLEYLWLFKNNIKVIPEEIGNLNNLKYLLLNDNPIKSLPNSIGKLTNLKILNLSHTQLKSLPKSLENLKNLEMLEIVDTQVPLEDLKKLKEKLPNTKIYNGAYIEL